MKLVWEREKPGNWCAAGSEFYILCELINCVSALGLFQVALGFCGSGFFGGELFPLPKSGC